MAPRLRSGLKVASFLALRLVSLAQSYNFSDGERSRTTVAAQLPNYTGFLPDTILYLAPNRMVLGEHNLFYFALKAI